MAYNKISELTEQERKERLRMLHNEVERKRRRKQVVEAYKTLVEVVLDLSTIEHLSSDEIALKLADNGQFRIFIAQKPKNSSKSQENGEKSTKSRKKS